MNMKVEIRRRGSGDCYRKVYRVILGDDETEIDTILTPDPTTVDSWIADTFVANRCRLRRLIVGLDIEWSPHMHDCDHSVATLQLCVGKRCLIYQIIHAKRIPQSLRDFLLNPHFTFVGVGIKDDVWKLWNDWSLDVGNTRDLRPWAAEELGRKELCGDGSGLKLLVKEVVGEEMDKPKNISCSRWNDLVLSRKQITYACLDAYFSFEIGRRLSAWYY